MTMPRPIATTEPRYSTPSNVATPASSAAAECEATTERRTVTWHHNAVVAAIVARGSVPHRAHRGSSRSRGVVALV
jgi:hypothetical protein